MRNRSARAGTAVEQPRHSVATAALATPGTITASTGSFRARFHSRATSADRPARWCRCPETARASPPLQCPSVPPGDYRLLVTTRASADAAIEFGLMPLTTDGHDLANVRVVTSPEKSGHRSRRGRRRRHVPANTQVVALETDTFRTIADSRDSGRSPRSWRPTVIQIPMSPVACDSRAGSRGRRAPQGTLDGADVSTPGRRSPRRDRAPEVQRGDHAWNGPGPARRRGQPARHARGGVRR